MTGPGAIGGSLARLMRLLFRCTQHGVTVEFLALAHGEQPGLTSKPATEQAMPGPQPCRARKIPGGQLDDLA